MAKKKPSIVKKPIKIMVRGVRYDIAVRPARAGWTVEWNCLEPGCKRSWSATVNNRQDAEIRSNDAMIAHGLESHAQPQPAAAPPKKKKTPKA